MVTHYSAATFAAELDAPDSLRICGSENTSFGSCQNLWCTGDLRGSELVLLSQLYSQTIFDAQGRGPPLLGLLERDIMLLAFCTTYMYMINLLAQTPASPLCIRGDYYEVHASYEVYAPRTSFALGAFVEARFRAFGSSLLGRVQVFFGAKTTGCGSRGKACAFV